MNKHLYYNLIILALSILLQIIFNKGSRLVAVIVPLILFIQAPYKFTVVVTAYAVDLVSGRYIFKGKYYTVFMYAGALMAVYYDTPVFSLCYIQL